LPWQYYQASFKVDRNWKTINIPFESFKRSGVMLTKVINAKNIKSIAIVAFGKEYKVLIDVNNINIY